MRTCVKACVPASRHVYLRQGMHTCVSPFHLAASSQWPPVLSCASPPGSATLRSPAAWSCWSFWDRSPPLPGDRTNSELGKKKKLCNTLNCFILCAIFFSVLHLAIWHTECVPCMKFKMASKSSKSAHCLKAKSCMSV